MGVGRLHRRVAKNASGVPSGVPSYTTSSREGLGSRLVTETRVGDVNLAFRPLLARRRTLLGLIRRRWLRGCGDLGDADSAASPSHPIMDSEAS
jgi:hypothetical protein